jgi:hypothetical protein
MALRLRVVICLLRAEGSDGYGNACGSVGIADELRCTHQRRCDGSIDTDQL